MRQTLARNKFDIRFRVRLSKRRAKGGVGVQPATNAVLAVHHRTLNEQEEAAQEMRRSQLEALEQEEEEEPEVRFGGFTDLLKINLICEDIFLFASHLAST